MSRKYRNCESKLKSVKSGSKSDFLSYSFYYSKLSDVADESPFETGDEDSQYRRLADTLKNLYDIKRIVNSSYFSSDKIDKLNDIIYSTYSGEKDYEIATSIKNELECIQRNNNASSVYDYNKAYSDSKVSYLYNIYKENENKARDEDNDRNNSIIVRENNKTYNNLNTLINLYDQSNDYSLKTSISNNYCEIFRYLMKKNNKFSNFEKL